MYEFTIQYWYLGTTATLKIQADDDQQAISLMWLKLNPFFSLEMAYQKSRILDVRQIIS